jgi:hypothetical protein
LTARRTAPLTPPRGIRGTRAFEERCDRRGTGLSCAGPARLEGVAIRQYGARSLVEHLINERQFETQVDPRLQDR